MGIIPYMYLGRTPDTQNQIKLIQPIVEEEDITQFLKNNHNHKQGILES